MVVLRSVGLYLVWTDASSFFGPFPAYRTKSVSGPIIHSFRNGYLVLW